MKTTTHYDVNSIKNQNIKSKFIERDVYCNVNTLVEYCLKMADEDRDAPFTLDDIENYFSYPEYFGDYAKFSGGTEDQRDEEIKRLRELQDEYDTDDDDEKERIYDAIRDEIAELEELESEGQDIYEWWAVSSYLFDKLKEQGEPVLDAGSCYVWGRTTSGQAILLDGVISKICSDMEILEGQANEWTY